MDEYRKASEDAIRAQSRHRNQNTENHTTLDVRADEPGQGASKPPSVGQAQLSSKSNRNYDGFGPIPSQRTRFKDHAQKLTIQEYARDGFETQFDGPDFNKKRPLTSKVTNSNKRYLLRRQQSRRQDSVKAGTSNSQHHPYRPKVPPS